MKYGIFGLTCDPCTPAHYEIVKKVLDDKIVDKVIVIPTVVDYYRKDKGRMFSNEQRLKILKKWFNDNIDVIIDDFEYKLTSDYPTLQKDRRYYHTLIDAIHRYGKDNEYATIVGGDSWNNLDKWFNFEKLGNATKFIVVRRNEEKLIDWAADYKTYDKQPYAIITLNDKFKDISATDIRNHLYDTCYHMSVGPNGTVFNVYLEEIEDYKETGKTYADYEKAYDDAKKAIDKMTNTTDNEELLAHTPIFDLVKSPEVEAGFRPVKIKSHDWVTIIVEKDGEFLMEKQLRHGLNKEFEEFPCGIVEDGEQPIVAALRELKEETGIEVNRYKLTYLGKFAANPAFMNNHMHYFHIELKDYVEGKQQLDEHEHLIAYFLNKNTAFDNFMKSEGSSIMGCAWMLLIREGIVNEWND